MADKELYDQELYDQLDLLKRSDLIKMIMDMEKTIDKLEEKERKEKKQRPIPDDWPVNNKV